MKKRMRDILFIISIVYSLAIIIFMTLTLINAKSSVELYDSEENIKKIAEYKKEVNLLPQNSCTYIIKDIIEYYEITSYNGEVNLKEMYDFSEKNSLLSFYVHVKDNCSLTDKLSNEYNLPTKFLTASIQQDELFHRYYFQYELSIKDVFTRSVMEASMTNVEYKIRKNIELDIISNLIALQKEGEVNE